MVYTTLFFISLLAATLLPGGSEALLLYNILEGYDLFLLLLVATIGNTTGSLINYFLGHKGADYLLHKGVLDSSSLQKGYHFFEKYGIWALLLSWVPIIGDPITLVAGVLKYDIKSFIMIVFFAKGVRYLIVAYIVLF